MLNRALVDVVALINTCFLDRERAFRIHARFNISARSEYPGCNDGGAGCWLIRKSGCRTQGDRTRLTIHHIFPMYPIIYLKMFLVSTDLTTIPETNFLTDVDNLVLFNK